MEPAVIGVYLSTKAIVEAKGVHCGAWVHDFSDLDADLEALADKFGVKDVSEPVILDYQGWQDLDPKDYALAELSELVDLIVEHKEKVRYCVHLLGAHYMKDIPSLAKRLENMLVYESADHLVESYGILERIPDDLQAYFNVEAWARDFCLNGDAHHFDGEYIEFT